MAEACRNPDLTSNPGAWLGAVLGEAALLGQDLGLSERDLSRLRMAALLHDVGKIAIPEALLGKVSKVALRDDAIKRMNDERMDDDGARA